jgi:S-adenosylmethionine:tRNA ribosyltransferase-isomerase
MRDTSRRGETSRRVGPPDLRETSAYDYELPPERVARYPSERRDASRLLVVPRGPGPDVPGAGAERTDGTAGPGGPFRDLRFAELPDVLEEGDLLVLNESRVLPVRLLGRKPTGAECEVFLLRPADRESDVAAARRWEALVRPGSKLKPGRTVVVSSELSVVVEGGAPGGGRIVRLETQLPVDRAIERYGRVPLPPYLNRDAEPLDRERYQTVYARDPGSVAAPTAGLHFTPSLLAAVAARGIGIAKLTLHVGIGTFRPVDSERVREHVMDREEWQLPEEAAEAIRETRAGGGKVWAVGTTVVRTLESAATDTGEVRAGKGTTDLFITPGYPFRVVDALITNFHLPRSTLLMLVAAFAGYGTTMAAYAHAIRSGYRFYSYGDAMAIVPRARGMAS